MHPSSTNKMERKVIRLLGARDIMNELHVLYAILMNGE